MAIIDERLEFCDATALSTSGTGLALVGDVVDNTTTSSDLGMGEPLYLIIQVTTAVTSGGSATVNFKLASDAQAAIAVDGTATVHNVTADIPKATLTAGHRIVMPLSSGTVRAFYWCHSRCRYSSSYCWGYRCLYIERPNGLESIPRRY